MSDDNSIELTEDQNTLVVSFNVASEYFKQRLLDDDITRADGTLAELVEKHGPQQASSKIAEEAHNILSQMAYEDQGFLQAIKMGASKDGEGDFFARSILDQSDDRLKEKIAQDCKVKILVCLFTYAKSEALLPDSYILGEMRELGQAGLTP